MAIKDYWVYQKRDTEKPWAFLIVKEYDKRAGSRATCLDITFYHEDIPNTLHAISEVCIHYDNLRGYVDHLVNYIVEWSNIEHADKVQLERELANILI